MENQTPYIPSIQGRAGGRAASPEYRRSLGLCNDFTGLEENTNRYDLLLLVKRAGRYAGFSSKMIELLDYYMAFTRDIDWEQGSRPVVYQSLSRTALDLGVTERQIQRLEKQLFEVGAITWNDSGNHKRYGQRDAQTGAILYAFGADLTPLAYLKPDLQEKLQEKQLYDEAWMETKRRISWYRRQIKATLSEIEIREEGALPAHLMRFEAAYEDIAVQIRTHLDLAFLRDLLAKHEVLYTELLTEAKLEQETIQLREKTNKESPKSDKNVSHYKSTTQQQSDKSDTNSDKRKSFQKSVAENPVPKDGAGEQENLILASGLQHITLKQVLNAGSERFRELLPLENRPMNWNDVTEAAYRLRPKLFISQQSWAEACEILGRAGASICVLLTDQATQREYNPVTQPAAYFRGMVNKARAGELRLHNSIFGLLKASETANSNDKTSPQSERN